MAKTCAKCNHPVFSKGLCHGHWKQAYGKPIPRAKEPIARQRTPIKKVSQRKALDNELYKKIRAAWLPQHETCEAQLPGCTQKATEVHHMEGREGILLLHTPKWLAVCHHCHGWITENSREAIELGLSYSRHKVNASGTACEQSEQ
jgi:hypothetical protein